MKKKKKKKSCAQCLVQLMCIVRVGYAIAARGRFARRPNISHCKPKKKEQKKETCGVSCML